MKNIDKKLYHFALYGLSGSGKTCLLTAMAMPQRITTDGSFCGGTAVDSDASEATKQGQRNLDGSRNREEFLKHAYDVSTTKEAGELFYDYTQMQDTLFPAEKDDRWKGYINKIKTGGLPKPTPHGMDKFPIYRYEGKYKRDDKVCHFFFEIPDYAGGRFHPNAMLDADKMTEELREQMLQADGIVLLAPLVGKEENRDELYEQLTALQKSFGNIAVKTGERRCPIALVFSKWDMCSDVSENSPDGEQENLKHFIEGDQVYQGLINAFQTNDFKVFPVSALGKCKENGCPEIVEPVLNSYGVPFPFIWLVERINAMETERLEKLPRICPFRKQKTLKLANQLLNRLPETEIASIQKVKDIRWTLRRNIFIQWVLVAAVVLFSCNRVLNESNNQMLRKAETILASATDEIHLDRYEKKLETFIKGSYLPFTRSHSQTENAKKLLNRFYETREKIAYNSFNLAPLEPAETKIQAARNYLTKYPNGRYVDDVQEWMITNAKGTLVAGNQKPLDDLAALWTTLKNSTNTADIQEVIDKGIAPNFFVYPFYVNDEQKAQKDEIVAAATSRLAELNWMEYERTVRESLGKDNIAETLKLLPEGKSGGEKWDALCKEVLDQVSNKVDARVRSRGSSYQRAIDDIEETRSAAKALSNAGMGRADELVRMLNDKIESVKTDWDKFLYGKVQSNRNSDACDNYLAEAPLKAMRSETDRYKKWIVSNREAVESYRKRKEEFLLNHRGEGRVPPYPTGATCWEDVNNAGWFSTSKQYIYQPGQWLPVGTKIRAESSEGANKGLHTIEEATDSDITEADVPRNFQKEPALPDWHK